MNSGLSSRLPNPWNHRGNVWFRAGWLSPVSFSTALFFGC